MKKLVLVSALSLALAACGGSETPPAADNTAPAPAPAASAPAPAASGSTAASAPAASAPASGAATAAQGQCEATVTSNDQMKYDIDKITVDSSCKEFKITLKNAGTGMEHNLVVAKAADMDGIGKDGAGNQAGGYLKAGDSRVIVATKMIKAGGSETITLDATKLEKGGQYKFFCTFPGHIALMNGAVEVK